MARINELADELFEYGVKTDRDLIKLLGIKPKDKRILFAWIEYQSEYKYREGVENGKEELKMQLKELLTPSAQP